jgi:uncharacterized DUF497 family protein
MRFEFDPVKSTANMDKHGMTFLDAQVLWNDPDRIEIPARLTTELRCQVIGRIGRDVWSAFITYRHETIRIISVRRARKEERDAYFEDDADVR